MSSYDELLDPDRDIWDLFWIIPLFHSLERLETIEKKLLIPHDEKKDALFSGFKLVLRTILRSYLQYTFRDNDFIGLKEDWTTRRAFFCGLQAEKMPPSSEKAIAFKNLEQMFDKIYGSRDFASLRNNLETVRKKFVRPLEEVLASNCDVSSNLSARFDKNTLLTFGSALRIWNWACAIDRVTVLKGDWGGIPLKDPALAAMREKSEHYFLGYKIGLSWIWDSLFGQRASSFVNEIDLAKTWEQLAHACNFGGRATVQALEKDLGVDIGLTKFLVKRSTPDKKHFEELLSPASMPKLTLNEKVDQTLLWYQYEVVDSGSQKIFSGSSTLISLIKGEIMTRKEHGIGDKLAIVRFKHVGSPTMYSYGVLLERFGSFSDFSGWMIFLEVGGDYAGLGGSEYLETETIIMKYSKNIELRELAIDGKELQGFFLEKIRSQSAEPGSALTDSERNRLRVTELEDLLSHSRELLLELLTKCYFEDEWGIARIHFDNPSILKDRWEIDVLGLQASRRVAIVAECSTYLPISHIQDFIEEISRKAEWIRGSSDYSEYSVLKAVVTSKRTLRRLRDPQAIRRLFEKKGISLLTVEEDIIPRLRSRYRKDQLHKVFGDSEEDVGEDFGHL